MLRRIGQSVCIGVYMGACGLAWDLIFPGFPGTPNLTIGILAAGGAYLAFAWVDASNKQSLRDTR